MPPSLVFDMQDGETAAAPATAKVVTQKRKATGDAVTIIYRGVGPVADIKEGFGLPLLHFAVVEDTDTAKRSRAVLTAIGDGSVGAVLLPPVHEKSAVKTAYLADQGTQKALVPWAKLPSMLNTTWMGPHMTISDALKEYTKPKSRVPAAAKEAQAVAVQAEDGAAAASTGDKQSDDVAKAKKSAKEPSKKKAATDPVALPTVTVPKPVHEIRRVAPNPVKRKLVEESDSDDVDLTRDSDDSESEEDTDEDDDEAQTDDSGDDTSEQDDDASDDDDDKPLASATEPDEPEEEPEQSDEASDDDEEGSDEEDTDDAESAEGSDDESEGERPAKRRRTFEVTAKYLDDDREMIARFKVHSKAEMNRVFASFRKSGCV